MVICFECEVFWRVSLRIGYEWDIIIIFGMIVIFEVEGGNISRMFFFNVGIYYYELVGDYNVIVGVVIVDLDWVVKEYYGFVVDVVFIIFYNSDNMIYFFLILKFLIVIV